MTPETSAFPDSLALTNDDSVLEIRWDDGHKSRHRLDVLRAACPCARCQGHSPEERLNLRPDQFPGIKLTDLAPVGRYAYNFVFSDGHNTGIYTLRFLHELENTA